MDSLGLDSRFAEELVRQLVVGSDAGSKFFRPELGSHQTTKQKIVAAEPSGHAAPARMQATDRRALDSINDAVLSKAQAPQVQKSEATHFREEKRSDRVRRAA
jgi:hypothetical protein